jgi:hypothetical protein
VAAKLEGLQAVLADEGKHGARLSERVDRHKERLDDLDHKISRSVPIR